MATYRQPPPLRADGVPGNGKPGVKPYIYRGNGDSAPDEEVQAFLASARARIAARQATAQAFRAELPGDAFAVIPDDHDWPDSHEALTAAPASTVAKAQVTVIPISPNGRRRPWCEIPAALAARLAELDSPPPAAPPPRPPRRCRSCGYLRTRCTCRRPR